MREETKMGQGKALKGAQPSAQFLFASNISVIVQYRVRSLMSEVTNVWQRTVCNNEGP